MSIAQFFRTLWAYRLWILASTLACFIGATAFVHIVKPRYQAETRVMLDIIKPDPVTGEVIQSAFVRAYIKTQTEMIKGQQVARIVVRDLGLDKNPAWQAQYRKRDTGRDLDFSGWAAQKVIEGAGADLITGSNILSITYSSSSPETSKKVADALLKAYMDLTLQSRRDTARRNAEWYEQQAEKTKEVLFAAEAEKAAFERTNGIILQEDKTDLESARLRALAGQGAAPVISAPTAGPAPAQMALANLDAEIAEASKTLGPNHPQLQQMKARRALLAQQAAQERSSGGAAAGAAASAARATAGMLEQQKAKVMAEREKVEKLRLMQDQIDLRRDQYGKTTARAAQLRQEAEIADAGMTPLAAAITPQSPVFPKKALIMGASVPAGMALGVLMALFLELVGRRIRSADDLAGATSATVLAVIQDPESKKRARPRLAWPRRNAGAVPSRVAQA